MTIFTVNPNGPLTGDLTIPGDKSISHRAVILGSIATGQSIIHNILMAEDVLMTMDACRACGVKITGNGSTIYIDGRGLTGLRKPATDVHCGNAGTAMRLLAGLFAAQNFSVRLTGDDSLSARPMLRVVEPLRLMGADIELSNSDCAPITIKPVNGLEAINWKLPVASAQVKSSVLLAGLYVPDTTTVIEPEVTRDHTLNLLKKFGSPVERDMGRISITGGIALKGQEITVPADFSSAAFFLVAATLIPGSDITMKDVGFNPTRTALVDVLKSMGAQIEIRNERILDMEQVADLQVKYAGRLKGTVVNPDLIPRMIDEIPIVAIAAACAEGVTVISGCEELRVKESDRIHSVATGLQDIGISVGERQDGLIIQGGKPSGGTIDSFGDHRIAMAFAVIGAVSESGVKIVNCDCVSTSFPDFTKLARSAGIDISEDEGVA